MILKIFMDAMFLVMIYMGAREMYSYYKETMGGIKGAKEMQKAQPPEGGATNLSHKGEGYPWIGKEPEQISAPQEGAKSLRTAPPRRLGTSPGKSTEKTQSSYHVQRKEEGGA